MNQNIFFSEILHFFVPNLGGILYWFFEVALWLAGALRLDIWLAESAIYLATVWKPSKGICPIQWKKLQKRNEREIELDTWRKWTLFELKISKSTLENSFHLQKPFQFEWIIINSHSKIH